MSYRSSIYKYLQKQIVFNSRKKPYCQHDIECKESIVEYFLVSNTDDITMKFELKYP
jgi:hypothetical protein